MATYVKGKNPNKPHTIRYFHDGGQHEKSFATKREATDWKAKFEFESREHTFVDPKIANEKFAKVAERWLDHHPGTPKTVINYEGALRLHILPAFGHKPLVRVAQDREEAESFLRETLPAKGLGASMIRSCYMILKAIVNNAVKSGRLNADQNRLKGIELPAVVQKADIVFASHEQIAKLAAGMPEGYALSIYLMRGCGLRLGESLGEMAIRSDRTSLRVWSQLAPDGKSYIPLKHRNPGDFRDIPLPKYVSDVIPKGDGLTATPVAHRTYRDWFNKARNAAGLPASFTPHTLRHVYASVALGAGIPISTVAKRLGHLSIQVTFGTYGHLVPDSWETERRVLDAEWAAREVSAPLGTDFQNVAAG
jgi:integrase